MPVMARGVQIQGNNYGDLVIKAAQNLPQTTTSTLYTVAGGAILVHGLYGLVTTALGATATNLSLGTTAGNTTIASATAVTSATLSSWIAPQSPPALPVAVPGQPAVAATGVAVQNVNSYPVQVVISANGATITNVSVNGVTVGTAAGTYVVPAYGSISIAYSVATPTWVWSNASPASAGLWVASVVFPPSAPFLLGPTNLTWTTSGSDTGQIQWYLWFTPVDAAATVS